MLPDDVHLQLKVHCAQCQTTLNDYFLKALKLYMHQECTSADVDTKSAISSD